MRLAIIAFAVGVWLFQTQARLPSPVFIAVLAALAVLVSPPPPQAVIRVDAAKRAIRRIGGILLVVD